MQFFKYHALGNDYLVLDPQDHPDWTEPSAAQTRVICHRNFGIGSDGILWGPLPSDASEFGLRIFNPDGSEAEKSGNGLRIFSRYLKDRGHAKASTFSIETLGGSVTADLQEEGRVITVDMGRVSFDSATIPVNGPIREVLNEEIVAAGRTFSFSAATIGNPHCVVPMDKVDADLAHRYGPALEVHELFPNKTNVQFLQVMDRSNIRIEIWERGAGYTLASGSSSSAAASVAHRHGWVDDQLTVHMPGGEIGIEIDPTDYAVRMTGPVTPVAEGQLKQELFTVVV